MPVERSLRAQVLEEARIVVVAGILVGVLVGGVGLRLAMLLLRVTSPDYAIGAESDDGFVIGDVSLLGTYQLLALGGLQPREVQRQRELILERRQPRTAANAGAREARAAQRASALHAARERQPRE